MSSPSLLLLLLQIDQGNMIGMLSMRDVVHVVLKEHRWGGGVCGPLLQELGLGLCLRNPGLVFEGSALGGSGEGLGGSGGGRCLHRPCIAPFTALALPPHPPTPRPPLSPSARLPSTGRKSAACRSTSRAPSEQLPASFPERAARRCTAPTSAPLWP